MKRILSTHFIIGLLFLVGCVGTEINRTVDEDNVFISPHTPSSKIKIDNQFVYIGEKDASNQAAGALSGEKTASVLVETYQFNKPAEQKWITVKIQRLTSVGWYFNPGFYKLKVTYDSGKKVFAGKRYEYCIFPYKNKNNTTYLVKAMGRLSGADNTIKFEIIYSKMVHGSWGNLSALSGDQREWLSSFVADSEKDIQIIE